MEHCLNLTKFVKHNDLKVVIKFKRWIRMPENFALNQDNFRGNIIFLSKKNFIIHLIKQTADPIL
jgi:hypothetical protein